MALSRIATSDSLQSQTFAIAERERFCRKRSRNTLMSGAFRKRLSGSRAVSNSKTLAARLRSSRSSCGGASGAPRAVSSAGATRMQKWPVVGSPSMAAMNPPAGSWKMTSGCGPGWREPLRTVGNSLPDENALNRRQLLRRRLAKLLQQLGWEGFAHPLLRAGLGARPVPPHPVPPHEPREHPTANIERPTSNDCSACGPWRFEVGCWLLDVPSLRFRASKREKSLSGNSLPKGEGGVRGKGAVQRVARGLTFGYRPRAAWL